MKTKISLTRLLLMMSLLLLPSMGLVSCSDDDEPFTGPAELTVTRDGAAIEAINFGTYGGHALLTLTSKAEWEITTDAGEWLLLSNRSGDATTDKEPRYIKISTLPMGKEATRSAKVTFRSGSDTRVLTVTQIQPAEKDDAGWETATTANRNMAVGLNLWNTLDAVGDWFDPDDIEAWETCWGQPKATQEWFDAVAASGFPAVRIPVTWYPHMDENRNIKEPWMARVEEVVNYGLNAGLYVILNVHHDTGAGEKNWLRADMNNIADISDKLGHLWTQIANRFNKYDHKLLFEGYNEMLDAEENWVEPVEGGYEAINILAQKFVDTVRATGGNNLRRNLIVNTYGAGGSKTRLDGMRLPTDQIAGHILLQVHNYTPAEFSNLGDDADDENLPTWTKEFEAELGGELELLIDYSNTFGVPVVIGECGAYKGIDENERAKFGEFITTYAKDRGNLSVFFWGDMIDRTTYQEMYPIFIDGFLKGTEW